MKIRKPAQKLLNALAVLKQQDVKEVSKEELGAVVKITGASTVRNALADLKKLGLITRDGGMVQITDAGMLKANIEDVIIPATNDEHHATICAELKPKEARLFNLLIDGLAHDKEALREKMGMAKNSTWRNLVAVLTSKKARIAENVDRGTIRLTKQMFPVGGRPGGN